MLDSVSTLKGYELTCLDGEIGSIKEFFFDDEDWSIRYLVANTGGWLTGRQVLISPPALNAVSRSARQVSLDLSKQQIENSPPLSSDEPVSRQFQRVFYEYYGWPMHWRGPDASGAYPDLIRDRQDWTRMPKDQAKTRDPHLRSTEAGGE